MPELDFKGLSLSDDREDYHDPFSSNRGIRPLSPSRQARPASPPRRLGPVSPSINDFGNKASTKPVEGSSTTRVRQRISRELIRETVQQRIADGSISRKGSVIDSATVIVEKRASRIEKDLPAPPTANTSIQMAKSHTTDAAPRKVTEDIRPTLRPRSQTQSAHDVLKANEKDGVIDEPKSALDQLMANISPSTDNEPKLQGILQKTEALMPPAVVQTRSRSPSPTGEGMAAREQAIIAKRREKDRENGGGGGVTRRRSLSAGNADIEPVVSSTKP